MKNQRKVPPKFGITSSSPSKRRTQTMNSEKWREVSLTRETILDLVASHLYNMRAMDRREINEIDIPGLLDINLVPIKIKMKEVSKPKDHFGEVKDAEMAQRT
jgi:hypothetical protein